MQKINVKKKKSEFINKRATGVILKCKNLLIKKKKKKKNENKYLKDTKYCKARDDCHYAGEYRQAAHTIYN